MRFSQIKLHPPPPQLGWCNLYIWYLCKSLVPIILVHCKIATKICNVLRMYKIVPKLFTDKRSTTVLHYISTNCKHVASCVNVWTSLHLAVILDFVLFCPIYYICTYIYICCWNKRLDIIYCYIYLSSQEISIKCK